MPHKSTHIPELAGDIETVTGEKIIEPGVRNIQSFLVNPAVNNLVPDEEQNVTWYFTNPPSRRFVTLRVEKGGVNDGNLGTNPFDVSWIAMGK